MRLFRESASQRSALTVLAFEGFFDFGGTEGSKISVRMSLYWGSERRRSARSWPMKPPAPVMRMFGILLELVVVL